MKTTRILARQAWLPCAGALIAAGCISPDATEDRTLARAAVSDRTGLHPRWAAGAPDPALELDGAAITAHDAVRIALECNPALRRHVLNIDEARAALSQASTPPNPTVDLMLGYPFGGPGGTAVFAAAMQQLAWLWTRADRIDAEEARLRAAALEAADDAIALVADVRERHVTVVALEESLRIATQAARAFDALERATRANVESGAAAPADLARVEAESAQAHRLSARTEAALAEAKAAFAISVGDPRLPSDWSTDGLWPNVDGVGDGSEAARWDARLDVLAADALVLAADADCAAMNASRIDDVAVGLAYDRQSMDTAEEAMLGPTLSIGVPVFDRGDARVAAAVAAREKAVWAARERRVAALSEVRAATATRDAMLAAWSGGSRRAADRAAAAAEAVRSQFDAGLASASDLARAEAMLADASLAAVEDRLDLCVATIRLDRSRGPSERTPGPDVRAGGLR